MRALLAVRLLLITGLLGLLMLGPASGPLAAQIPEEVQKLTDATIHRLRLQTRLPTELPSSPETSWFSFKLPPEALWLVVAVGIGVLVYSLRDILPFLGSRESGQWILERAATGEVNPLAPAVVLSTADEIAAKGSFVEAIHVLLLQGLAEMRQRVDQQFADSLTSREILRCAKISDAGRSALRDIISRVELTYFGHHPASAHDYAACRASFNALAEALHGTSA